MYMYMYFKEFVEYVAHLNVCTKYRTKLNSTCTWKKKKKKIQTEQDQLFSLMLARTLLSERNIVTNRIN